MQTLIMIYLDISDVSYTIYVYKYHMYVKYIVYASRVRRPIQECKGQGGREAGGRGQGGS